MAAPPRLNSSSSVRPGSKEKRRPRVKTDNVSYRSRKPTRASQADWNQPDVRRPYHEYVHQLTGAGWDNLQCLDEYMTTGTEQEGLVISVLDISDDYKRTRWPEIYTERDLTNFLVEKTRRGVLARLYLVEYDGNPSAGTIEALGSELGLDPRFFQLVIQRRGHSFTPSQRHRAPYLNLSFGFLDTSKPRSTDSVKFAVFPHIHPDASGPGWTGIFLFNSHAKIKMSPRTFTTPPDFQSQLPPAVAIDPKSARELYLESFEHLDISEVIRSPFYAISTLLRLSCFCWNQIVTAVREEDHRVNGISNTSLGHAEDIKKSLSVVERGGSLAWKGRETEVTTKCREELEEDFQHLVDQIDLLWQNRSRMAAISSKESETRWSSLTNAFTYLFAPVTIMTGVYGMNVSQISGSTSNPNIWQFFVAVAVLNVTVVLALSVSNWVNIQLKHGRTAGVKEVLGFAMGRSGSSAEK